MTARETLENEGWLKVGAFLPETLLHELRSEVFELSGPGKRCLLDHPRVRDVVGRVREELIVAELLPSTAVAIQAIAFDKTPDTNWKVAWHQDLMFPFADRVISPGYEGPSVKDGVHFARPPRQVLEALLAVRLHLDPCAETNGPLRVCPGSHRLGVLQSGEVSNVVRTRGDVVAVADSGELILMRPLLLHASSKATEPGHRRVLHLVYHSGETLLETWHRRV